MTITAKLYHSDVDINSENYELSQKIVNGVIAKCIVTNKSSDFITGVTDDSCIRALESLNKYCNCICEGEHVPLMFFNNYEQRRNFLIYFTLETIHEENEEDLYESDLDSIISSKSISSNDTILELD